MPVSEMDIEEFLVNLEDKMRRQSVMDWAARKDPTYAAILMHTAQWPREDRLEALLCGMIAANERSRRTFFELVRSLRPPDQIIEGQRLQFVPPS